MASVRDLWKEAFFDDAIPAFPCPACDRGILRHMNGSSRFERSEENRLAEQAGALFFPDDADFRFILYLKCSVATCGDIVCVHGEAKYVEREMWESDAERFVHCLYPKGMYPAPPLVTIPEETPARLVRDLKTAFSLFWVDLAACANRLRISVEHALDEQGVPKAGNLSDRINKFSETASVHGKTFDALRLVGNVGSHEGEVEREAVLDAFEVYQDTIAELFGKRSAKIDALRSRLLNRRGKYPS